MDDDEKPGAGDGAPDDAATERPARSGNRVFSGEEMEAAFGRHPWAGWKPVIRRRRKRR